ncbi:MAG: glycosyltransferase family 2 protein [Candidatus Thorarchaeota archaeon]|jgi:GT2 family glycosyltransferase
MPRQNKPSRKDFKRSSLKERLQKRSAFKKPTQSDLSNRGLTVEQVNNLFNSNQPKPRRKLNSKNTRRKKDLRPKTVQVVNKEPIAIPIHSEYKTPDWFRNDEEVDVSIIVPLYKSKEYINRQISSWNFQENITHEIIYVDDNCPNKSHSHIAKMWEVRNPPQKIGKIILNQSNGGFACACNAGASYAKGKYLIFLNADTEVSPNWIKPMIDPLADEEIGIVGNMQVRKDGKIDSAGSSWSWSTRSFQHIGRNVHRGKGIPKPYNLDNAPKDLFVTKERDMVTGCCISMRKNLFIDLNGFDDEHYKIGYWEDADLCMRVKAAGYKILYQPISRIIHKVGHSNAGGHPAVQVNRKLFKSRWIDTGRIQGLIANPTNEPKTFSQNINGKVVGCVIACNEEEFLEVSVDSVAPIVDEWVFVIGGNNYAYKSGMCDEKGYPIDSTLSIAKKLAAKYGGIVIEPPGRTWTDKVEMRNAYVNHLNPGDWMFMLDGDEVYKENQLWRIVELMKEYECMVIQFWVFWNNVHTLGTGVWEQYPQERIVHWKPGFKYRGKNHLHVSTESGRLIKDIYPTFKGKEKMFYHYSWVRPIEKIAQKLEYYKHQSGNTKAPSYVDDVFLKWRTDPDSVQGKTHPMRGGKTEPFPGVHPESIQELIKQGKLNF